MTEKKTTIWRLISDVLKGHMKEEIVKELQTYIEDNDNGEVSLSVLWGVCKAVMRGKTIATTAFLKKIRQLLESEQKVNQEIKRCKLNVSIGDPPKKLRFIKQRYYEVRGRSTKMLAYKLKKTAGKNTI